MSCVFKYHNIFGEDALSVDKILRHLVDNRNVAPESSTYKQVKALLQLCSLNTAIMSRDCLVENNDRFGLKQPHTFIDLHMEITDLLNPLENVSNCRGIISNPIYDPTDIFVSFKIKNFIHQLFQKSKSSYNAYYF